MTYPTPGWTGDRTRRGPVVQVRPVCRECGARLAALAPGEIPIRAGSPPTQEEVRTVSRRCGPCGEVTRIRVRVQGGVHG